MKAPKLVGIEIMETSGVDHPAHLREGWLVMKAASVAEAEAAFHALAPIQEDNVTDEQHEVEADVTEATPVEAAAPADTVDDITRLAEQIANLQAARIVAEEKHTDAVARLEAAIMEKDAMIDSLTKMLPEPEPVDAHEEMMKSLPEPIRKALEDAEARAEEAIAKAAAADAALETIRAERETAEWIVKASEFGNLAADPVVLGPILRKFATVDSEATDTLVEILKAADAQAESAGIFAEIGVPTPQVIGDGDAWSVIESLAKAKVAAGEADTIASAVAIVTAEQPDLYDRYRTERI